MKIDLRKQSDIKPYPGNPRVNDAAVDSVAASIREFGFQQPIVVDAEGVIVVGHTRWKAARKLGLEKVPVHVAKDLTPAQIKAYRIADNQTNTLAEWDPELLPLELAELQNLDFDMSLLGFDPDELADLLGGDVKEGLCDPDEIPAQPDEATTQTGDLWILGDHRLLCGDSSKPEEVDRLLDGATIHLVNTDPPYNVKVEPRSNNAIAAGLSSFQGPKHHQSLDLARHPGKSKPTQKKMRAKDRPLANDFVSDEQFADLLRAWFKNLARVLGPGRAAYIWGGYANVANYPPALKEAGLYFSQTIIWDKQHPVLTRKDFLGNHEWCFYGWREGAAHVYLGPNNAVDVWTVKKVNPQSMVHLTEKPTELAGRAMRYSSRPDENVLDLFGGRWRVVKLPALAEEDDPLGRAKGEALWPEMYSREALEKRRASNTPYYWQAMYQQNPLAEGSTEWPESYFGPDIWFDVWPTNWQIKTVALDPSKGTDARFGDYSAFVLLSVGWDGVLYVEADLDIRNCETIVDAGLEIQRRFRPDAFSIEANQFQHLLASILNERAKQAGVELPIYTIDNQVNKLVRIRRLTQYLATRQIRFKADSPGTRLLVSQLREFPLSQHDDGPDALEMSIRVAADVLTQRRSLSCQPTSQSDRSNGNVFSERVGANEKTPAGTGGGRD